MFGLPVIAANVPVANEVFDSGAVYCTVDNLDDAADKMHLLARDSQFYARQAEASLKRGKDFSWDRAAKETLDIYKSVI